MIKFHDALEIFDKIEHRLPKEEIKLVDAFNRILGEDIYSDINMPPFDKSAMDGYACRKEDLADTLEVIETIHAGQSASKRIEPGKCIKIMTGAPVPEGADTVIIVEHTREIDDNHITYTKASSKSNICKKAEDLKKGEQVLSTGTLLLPQHIATLASVGMSTLKVFRKTKMSIFTTGSELVEPGTKPENAQIRNSNAYNLSAQLKQVGIDASYLGIVADDKNSITNTLKKAVEASDVVIISGGASVGEYDFIPTVVKEIGFDIKFDKLAIQPGKPVSFSQKDNKFCFGLSGNPVSSYLQFEILVKPFLYQLMGHTYNFPIQLAPLNDNLSRKLSERLKFVPVKLNSKGAVEEIQFNGSAHISGLSQADGFGLFPLGCDELATDELIEVLRIK